MKQRRRKSKEYILITGNIPTQPIKINRRQIFTKLEKNCIYSRTQLAYKLGFRSLDVMLPHLTTIDNIFEQHNIKYIIASKEDLKSYIRKHVLPPSNKSQLRLF
jgi:hypothetical protein